MPNIAYVILETSNLKEVSLLVHWASLVQEVQLLSYQVGERTMSDNANASVDFESGARDGGGSSREESQKSVHGAGVTIT